MIELMHRSHPCDLGSEPNREGYLILGPCPVVATPVPEVCPPRPPDADFGILPCRCLKSRHRIVQITSGTTPLRPHDRVRLDIQAKIIADL